MADRRYALLGHSHAAGSGSVVWGAITGTLSAQTDLQSALDAKLATSGLLAAILAVDGAGSGIDADLLDGQSGAYYAAASSLANYLPLTGGTLTGSLVAGGDITGATVAGITAANLVDKSASESVTGAWNFSSTDFLLPGHWYTNTYDGSNVYFHVGTATATAKTLNLRVYKADDTVVTYTFTPTEFAAPASIAAASFTEGGTSLSAKYLGIGATAAAAAYADRLSRQDTRSTENLPGALLNGTSFEFKSNTTDGLSDGGTYHHVLSMRRWADASGGASAQLAFTDNGNMYLRYGASTWSGWSKFLRHDATAPVLTGNRLEIQGSGYTTSPTGTTIGLYNATTGYVQAPGGASGVIDIWDNTTSYIARFGATNIAFARGVTPNATNTIALGTDALRWSGVYATAFYEAGTSLASKYLALSGGTMTGGLTTTGVTLSGSGGVASAGYYGLASGNGNGIRFWANDTAYSIWMSSAADATYGGRVTGETTSDYNMYFRMLAGTNRGFAFYTGATDASDTVIFGINPDAVRSAVSLYAPTIYEGGTALSAKYLALSGGTLTGALVTASAGIELGHATDTTLTRAAAGKVNIEGKAIVKHTSSSYTSGEVTFSTADASGGSSGDIWFKYTA